MSFWGSVLLSSAGFLASCRRSVSPVSQVAGVRIFDAREFRALNAFCAAVLPDSHESAIRAVPYRIDNEVSFWTQRDQAQLRSLVALIEGGTRYFFYSLHPFSSMPIADRQKYLRGWESSRFDFRRQAFQALRMLAFFYFYTQDQVWNALGYDGPWVKPSGERTPA